MSKHTPGTLYAVGDRVVENFVPRYRLGTVTHVLHDGYGVRWDDIEDSLEYDECEIGRAL